MSRPLKIAVFTERFPVVSETFILRQITGLIELGHSVDIYADSAPDASLPIHPEIAKYQLDERTTYMDMPPEVAPWEMPVWPMTGRTWLPGSKTSIHNIRRIARALPKFFRSLLSAPGLTIQALKPSEYSYHARSLSTLYRLAKLCSQRKDYDILHAHFGPVGNRFRFARQLWKVPLIVSFHGYDFSAVPQREGIGTYSKLFATADAITINSEFTRAQVAKLGCPEAKFHKIPVGLNPGEFAFQERTVRSGESIRILTLARLVAKKGHEFSLRAFARAREKHPQLEYDIVGDGPLRSDLEKLAHQLGIEAHVHFHGAAGSNDVRRHFAQSHLFMLASVTRNGDQEGQGLVLQEAQAAGLPILATTHGPFPEGVLVDKSAFLVPEGDVNALAERLGYLVEHPETWPEMGRQGRGFVEEHFDIRDLNRRLVEVYEKLATSPLEFARKAS